MTYAAPILMKLAVTQYSFMDVFCNKYLSKSEENV
jgi:hypothetical protein